MLNIFQSFANEKIKIGLIVPLSGEYKEIGSSIVKSARLAVNKIDDSRIEIIPRDTKSNPENTLRVSKELYEQMENNGSNYYEKRTKRLNSINWRSRLNYFSFHLSNPLMIQARNFMLKKVTKSGKFLDKYLGNIYQTI